MEHALKDTNGRTVAMGSLQQMTGFLKHHVPDGDYAIEGTGTNATFYRINGVVYPSGGMIAGQRLPPRSREECVETFRKGR